MPHHLRICPRECKDLVSPKWGIICDIVWRLKYLQQQITSDPHQVELCSSIDIRAKVRETENQEVSRLITCGYVSEIEESRAVSDTL